MAVFTAIASLTAWVAGSSLLAGLSAAAALSAATAIVSTAISIGISLIARALQPKVSIPQAEIKAVLNQTDAPRRVYVGQYLAGGIRAFFDVRGGNLYQLVLVSHGPITEFMQFYKDSKPIDPDSGRMQSWWRDGSALGGDYSQLSGFSSWDANRKLTNQATFLVRMSAPKAEGFGKIFPKGSNTLAQWEIKGQAIYDPRTEATAYSDNAALVQSHYLTHPDGYKLDHGDVDWDNVEAMADVADLPIAQKAGGTAPNLRLWGYWTLDEGPGDVLARMHSSSGIRAYEMQDGRIGLIGGNFGTPACTLTAKDIKEIQTSEAINEREGYNTLRVFHIDASQKYELTEVDSWKDSARLAIEGEIVQEYKMDMCPNLSQARRLAKQQIHNDNRAKVQIITNLVGLKARFPKVGGQRHTILLDYQPEDGSGRIIQGEYEVMDHEFDPIGLECRIELERADRASEEWSVEEEGEAPAPLPEDVPSLAPPLVAAVSRLVVNSGGPDGRAAMIRVEAAAIPGREDITLHAQYKVNEPDSNWFDMQTTDYTALSGVVSEGLSYQVQARFEGVFDVPDVWHNLGSIYISSYDVPPDAPTELIPSNGAGYVHLSWRNPSTPFADLRIYRSEGAVFANATLVGKTGGVSGQISEYSDNTIAAATEYNYWVAAANVSGVEGAPVGPANITTT